MNSGEKQLLGRCREAAENPQYPQRPPARGANPWAAPCRAMSAMPHEVHPFKIQQEHLILGGMVGLGAAGGHGEGTRTVSSQGLQYPVAHTWHQHINNQQNLSKQDLSRRAWKGAGPDSGTPAGKRQLQVAEQLCQDILEWAGSLHRQRGTLGLWDRQGTHPSATSIWGMFWYATLKDKQQGWGTQGVWGGGSQEALSHRAMPTPSCPDARVMDARHPTHHRSPSLWGWGRLQVAPMTPYTPETTIPPPGFTAATRAQQGPVPGSQQPKLLQHAMVAATQWFHGRSWAQPVPQGQVSPAAPVPTAAEQCVSRPRRHCCHRHHHCHHPSSTPQQGRCTHYTRTA